MAQIAALLCPPLVKGEWSEADHPRADDGKFGEGGGGGGDAGSAPANESDQDRSSRKFSENYQRVQDNIEAASDRELELAAQYASRVAINLQPKAWGGDANAERMRAAMHAESEALKFVLRMRQGATQKVNSERVRLRPGASLLRLVKWDESQERDEIGRFGSGGGAGADRSGASTDKPSLGSLFSGSLGIERGDMPQIPNDHKAKFAEELRGRGISMLPERVSASSLKPTQREFNAENVAFLRGEISAGKYKDNPIVVSREGRVLDGHHRWAVEAQDGGKMDVLRVDLPIRDLLREAAAFNARNGITARAVSDKVSRAKLGKLLKVFDPDQARDEGGRWTAGGGGAGALAPEHGASDPGYGMNATAGMSTPSINLMSSLNTEHLRRLGPEAANTLTAMYRQAAETKPDFDRTLERIAGAVNGKAVLPPLKGSDRATEKIVDDYAGDASQIKDILRATVEVRTVAEAQTALASMRGAFDVLPGGFRNLLSPDVDPVDGYRDIKMNVKVNGVMAEIQINVPAVLAVKDRYHKEYEERRTIEGRVFAENRQPSADEQSKIDSLNATMKAAYADVWKSISGGP